MGSNGTVIQSSLVGIGEDGVLFGAMGMRWNMYTAAAWISAAMGLVAAFLFLPCIFTEFNMAEKEVHWIRMRMIHRYEGTSFQSSMKFIIIQCCIQQPSNCIEFQSQ